MSKKLLEGTLMKKPKSKQTEPENLSKKEEKWLSEVDWDLLEELDSEDEGQHLPMRDYPSEPSVPEQNEIEPQEDIREVPSSRLKKIRKEVREALENDQYSTPTLKINWQPDPPPLRKIPLKKKP